jgi:hypothetical protein
VLGANIDIYTLMPFDFGSGNIYNDTVGAFAGLKIKLKATFGWTDAHAYAHQGISGMNGLSDQQELTSTHGDLVEHHHLGQGQGPWPARVLVGEPRPRLRRWRRGVQLQRHRPAGLGVHPDHRRLLMSRWE